MAKEMPTSVLRTAREAGKIEGHACGLPRGCIIVTRIILSIAKFFVRSMETLIFPFFFLFLFLILCISESLFEVVLICKTIILYFVSSRTFRR